MSRHKFVVLGVVALVAVTGCLGGLGGDGADGPNGDVEPAGNTTTVAVAVGLSAEAQQNITASLNRSEQRLFQRAQLASGNLSTDEQQRVEDIRRELQQAQQDAVESANSEFESAVNSSATLAVGDSIQSRSSTLYLVSGSPSEIVGLLDRSGVQAIASREQFDSLARQQQQAPAPGGGGAPTP